MSREQRGREGEPYATGSPGGLSLPGKRTVTERVPSTYVGPPSAGPTAPGKRILVESEQARSQVHGPAAAVQASPASKPSTPGHDHEIAAATPGIDKIGFIDNSEGSFLRTGPRELGGDAVRPEPLPPATRVEQGRAVVPTGKVEVYLRGKAKPFTPEMADELRGLKHERQVARKVFDASPEKAARIELLERLQHNHQRSLEMSNSLTDAGLPNTGPANAKILQHLLEVGQQSTKGIESGSAASLPARKGASSFFRRGYSFPMAECC